MRASETLQMSRYSLQEVLILCFVAEYNCPGVMLQAGLFTQSFTRCKIQAMQHSEFVRVTRTMYQVIVMEVVVEIGGGDLRIRHTLESPRPVIFQSWGYTKSP